MTTISVAAAESLNLHVAHANEIVPFEPLLVAVRISNNAEKTVRMRRPFSESLKLERRTVPNGDWERAGPSPTQLVRQPPGLVIPHTIDLPPSGEITWDEWIFWREATENGGRPFVFDEPGVFELRALLTVSTFPDSVAISLVSEPTRVVVKEPTDGDSRAARLITHPFLIPMVSSGSPRGDSRVASYFAWVPQELPTSSFADYCNYMAGVHHLGLVYEQYEQPLEDRNRGEISWSTGHAYDHFRRITDRNRLLRERGAIRLVAVHQSKSDLHDVLNLQWAREVLRSADFLPSDLFKLVGQQSVARYLYEQELIDYRDERLERKYMTQPTDDDTRETLVQRIATESGVGLSLAAVPQELKDARPGRLVQNTRQTLRAFLNFQRPQDWYWVRDGDGYALEFREPSFSGK